MARYNTVLSSTTTSAASASILSPSGGTLVEFTGSTTSATIGDPTLYAGQIQNFYNATGSTVTISSGGSGTFSGPAGTGSGNFSLGAGNVISVQSDGQNWVVLLGAGGAISGTTGAFSGNVTLTGSTPTLNLNNTAPTIATNSSGSTAAVFNTNATTVNIGGGATSVNIANNASTASTVTVGGAITANSLSINGTTGGTVSLTSAVTSGTVNVFNGTTGTLNIGTGITSGSFNLGSGMTTGTMTIGTAAAGVVNVRFNTSATNATTAALVVGGGVAAASAYFTSLTVTNTITGSVSGNAGTATTATNATNVATTGAVSTAGTYYVPFVASNGSSNQGLSTTASLNFNPSNGTLTATLLVASSDEKYKTNVTPITNALDKVLQLVGVEFDRISTGNHEIGVIAQQVEKILPEVVVTDLETGDKSVAYGNMVGLLIQAIKEQQAQIEYLKGRI